MMKSRTDEIEPADQPPFLKTWNRVYIVVLGFLVLLIVLFTVLTRIFS